MLHGWQWSNGGWLVPSSCLMPNSVQTPPITYQQAPTIDRHYNIVMPLPSNQFPQMQPISNQYHQNPPHAPTEYTHMPKSLLQCICQT